MTSETETSRTWTLLAAAVPVLLLGMFVIGASDSGERDPSCLPDMPSAPDPDGSAVWPITAPVSSPFGPRDGGHHAGADFAAPEGTPIVSATSGTVVAAGPADGFGNWIVIDSTDSDGSKVSAVYGHMEPDGVHVRVGDQVTTGTPIAIVGNAGQSSGPHLHFEIVPGGRLSGGRAVDPIPWLTTHAGPQGRPQPEDPRLVAAGTTTDMPPLPAAKGSEANMQVDAIRVARTLAAVFPQVERFEMWRATDDFPDHPSGRAVDAMIPDWHTDEGRALGDAIAEYVMTHSEELHVVYIIWQQQYRPVDGAGNRMEDRGSPTANHFDHVHITVEGGGPPAPGQTYGPVPQQAPPRSGCSSTPTRGSTVEAGIIPEAFVPWINRAATTCSEVTAPLIAAQLETESGFRVDAHNDDSQADGPGQFIPSTWDAKAVDGDGDGRRDTRSIPDAVMSLAAYDCELVGIALDGLASGALTGDLTELWLSMYNCGPSATLAVGRVCQNPETLAYVRTIPARAHVFAAGRQT
ncbi:peptidoglycan DD-metalloendopeptidase family protein [Nocardia sp. NPDC058499]|uniref:peptidoglycan DD-metalloendopeptidase family protein n=1 Tax=Nocardia sp. NPDC058499 TaxID=3346530 RepID=UPI00364762A0